MLPRLIAFITDTEPEDPEQARKLVAHTLTQYVSAVGKDHAPIVMSVVAPALLSRANSEGATVYQETSARLLELASADQPSFRSVVGNMSEGQRAFMEEVIRSGRQSGATKGNVASNQPTIALKMDFGG